MVFLTKVELPAKTGNPQAMETSSLSGDYLRGAFG